MSEEIPSEVAEVIRKTAQQFDTTQQAVIGTALSGEIVYWNETAEQLYGWTAEQARGRNILEVTPSNVSRDLAEEIMAELRKGRSWTGEFQVRRRDGEEFRVRVYDLPVESPDGELLGIVGTSMRIPEP